MAVAELALSLEPRGRRESPTEVTYAGEVGESDLALLAGSRDTKPRPIQKLRDRHHLLARCVAGGMSLTEASAITGYEPSRISVLKSDPAFKELVAGYQQTKELAFADFQDRAAAVALEALNLIHEELEDSPEEVSMGQKLEIVKTLADRTGNAPISRAVNVNANIDIGDRLNKANARVKAKREVEDAK